MKKKLLIMAMCLLAPLSANAATWIAIDSGSPDIQLFIDSDSIKYTSVDTCTYALLYKKGEDDTKILYVKSNYATDKAGVIRTEDFNPEKYMPGFYSKHNKTFMKSINENMLLQSAHNYALAQYSEKTENANTTEVKLTNLKNTDSYLATNNKLGLSDAEYNAYIKDIKTAVLANWKTSIDTVYTDVNLMLSINADGSLNGYRLMESNASDKAKRAAIAAANLAAPFTPFPDGGLINTTTINIPVKFEQKFFKKYVK